MFTRGRSILDTVSGTASFESAVTGVTIERASGNHRCAKLHAWVEFHPDNGMRWKRQGYDTESFVYCLLDVCSCTGYTSLSSLKADRRPQIRISDFRV
jgi:hypothetical protein